MKKPHQHTIPRTYLKNFANQKSGNKAFVHLLDKYTYEIKNNVSIKDVCVSTDFYTQENVEDDKKYAIEDFFSQRIESSYPDVYRHLVQEKNSSLSPQLRSNILHSILSMYFRTPKGLNALSQFHSIILTQLTANPNSTEIKLFGQSIKITQNDYESIRKEIKQKTREHYIKSQMEIFFQFIKFKMFCGISVIELINDEEFITCDNPVEIRNPSGGKFQLFDPANTIYVPLDPKHALFIPPNNVASPLNKVFYQKEDFLQHLILNNCTKHNAERWLIGTDTGIEKFLIHDKEAEAPGDDNHPYIVEFKRRNEIMEMLLPLMEADLSLNNSKLITLIIELEKDPLVLKSQELQIMLKNIRDTIGLT